MKDVVKFLFSSLQNSPFDVLKNFDDYGKIYVADVKETYQGAGIKRKYDVFEPVRDENGIYVFFHTQNGEILHVGAAGNHGGSTGFYAHPNTGIVPQLVNRVNKTIFNYFIQSVQLSTNKNFEDYINEYSVFFVCLKPLTSQSSFAQGLNVLVKALKAILTPKIP